MFVQVIKGKTTDPARLVAQGEQWREVVRPGATGYLGGTGGITDNGTFILLARFVDEAAARANSSRPEQSEWWNETASCFEGEPTFRESSDVRILFDGGSDDAGFVQVMEGTISDRAKADALESSAMLDQLRAARPDLIGGIRAYFDGGAFVEVAYFTSEEAARKGESASEFSEPNDAYMELYRDMTFTDIRDPMFTPPA